jgi:integrase
MTGETQKILDVKGAAALLGCSVSHVSNILNGRVEGVPRIPHVRAGRLRLIRLDSLMRWFEEQESAAKGSSAVISFSHPESVTPAQQEMILRKRRFQKGSLQQVRRGKAKRWVVLYYNGEGKRQCHTLLCAGSTTKGQAEKERIEFMRTINGCDQSQDGGIRPVLLREFIEQKFFVFQRKKWKASTAGTSENRIQYHIVKGIGDHAMRDFTLTSLQAFLERKADEGLSFSVVDHLRWDLSAIFEMAIAEKLMDASPATRLYTPKNAPKGTTRAMSVEEVQMAFAAVELREKVLLHMAVLSGFRPGEMLGLQRRHVASDGSAVSVEQRVYRGIIDDPKTGHSRREVAIPPQTSELLREWMLSAVRPEPEAFVFASENGRPVWRDTLLYDHIRPKLKAQGLEWVDFQVMRATHASIGHRLKLDPKVTADQRGHGVGVAIEEYTRTSLEDRAVAARKLEEAVLGKPKVLRMLAKRKAS